MPLGFLQQGPSTARLRGGGEEPEKDAEASDEEKGEPVDTTPGPEEPAGTRPGLQESSGIHSGSAGGRETRSKTGALLRIAEKEVAKSKTQEELPKGFEELPRTDPDYQGVQGFSFGDFPPLGGEGSIETTSNVTKGAKKVPSDNVGNVKMPVGEKGGQDSV